MIKKNMFNLVSRISEPKHRGTIRQIPIRSRGCLWVSPMPFGAYDIGNQLLRLYRQHHVQHVFILVSDDEIKIKTRRNLKGLYEKAGIHYTQYPFIDMQAPNLPMMHEFVKLAVSLLETRNVAIHCHAGVGRTSIGACCVVQALEQMTPAESIAFVKQHMEVNMTTEQQGVVMKFKPGAAGRKTNNGVNLE